jgi:glycosyltransferase involved in cell wall biosynthesis
MKLLVVTYGLPYPLTEGAKIRDYHLLRELSEEAEIVLLSLCKDDRDHPDTRQMQTFCHEVETFLPSRRRAWSDAYHHWRAAGPLATLPFYFQSFASRISELALAHGVETVQIEHSFLAPYVSSVPRGRRKVLSLHNIGERQYRAIASLPGAGPRAALKAVAMRGWEGAWAKRFDHCITVSAADARWLRGRAPEVPVTVIENGVNCRDLRPLPPPDDGHDLLFVGGLGYPPNADAVVHFARHCLPIVQRSEPRTRLVVVGGNPGEEVRALAASRSIELHRDVPDVLPFYRAARACVVPLRAGGGTRLKILEAMALGRAVVSTSAGCEGLEVEHENQLLVADGDAALAGQAARVLADRRLAQDLCARARRWVEQRHDWHILGGRLRQLHRDLAALPVETTTP